MNKTQKGLTFLESILFVILQLLFPVVLSFLISYLPIDRKGHSKQMKEV